MIRVKIFSPHFEKNVIGKRTDLSHFSYQITSNLVKKAIGFMSQRLHIRKSRDILFLDSQESDFYGLVILNSYKVIDSALERKNSNIFCWIIFDINYRDFICSKIKE